MDNQTGREITRAIQNLEKAVRTLTDEIKKRQDKATDLKKTDEEMPWDY